MERTYRGKRTLGLVTARGGSKSVPQKNIKPLLGKPLIAYTLQAAQKSRYLTHCIVSTDNPEIAKISRRFGGDVPFLRPKKLATDQASSLAVAKHALAWLRKHEGKDYDYLMILQPTSPLRITVDIDECIRKIVLSGADSVMSMVELCDFHSRKFKRIKKGIVMPLFVEEGKYSLPRDKKTPVYKRNCAIYLTKVECIMNGDLFGKISRAYVMPKERSIDINDPVDFDLAEFWLKRWSEKH